MPTMSEESGAGSPPGDAAQDKRTLTPGNFLRTVGNVLASGPVLIKAVFRPKISPALREKIMLGVTSITDCRLCQWGHTHWAMAKGVPLDEVNRILGSEVEALKALDPAEAAAILFARHYAENLDRIDPASLANLRLHFGEAEAAEILAYVRTITLGSLTGNTLDALLGRLRRSRGVESDNAPTTTKRPRDHQEREERR